MLATTAAEIRRRAAEHKIAALMGIEGGHMIDDDLRLLRIYAALGVRYMTLTHFKNNDWADSSTDKPAHDGLTPFGKDVVREMNRLGMMVDISHVADKTFFDALEVDEGAGHRVALLVPRDREPSAQHDRRHAARAREERRRRDDQLRRRLPERGVPRRQREERGDVVARSTRCEEVRRRRGVLRRWRASAIDHEAMTSGELPKVTWEKIVEHIDHAAKVAGVDHVGLGSDFDGATMPIGMEDASKLPKITDALLKKGYSEADVEKILGGNILRVMEAVEHAAGRSDRCAFASVSR